MLPIEAFEVGFFITLGLLTALGLAALGYAAFRRYQLRPRRTRMLLGAGDDTIRLS